MPKVAILTGSKSDVPTLDVCVETLGKLGIEHELHVMSAHRAPAKVQAFAAGAADAGFGRTIESPGGHQSLKTWSAWSAMRTPTSSPSPRTIWEPSWFCKRTMKRASSCRRR